MSGAGLPKSLGLIWLATATGTYAPDAQTAHTLGTYFLKTPSGGIGAIFFAVGSTIFAWLLLRGRMIPIALAGLGVLASLLAVVGLPLMLVHFIPDSLEWFVWIPLLLFEVPLGLWLIIKGAAPVRSSTA